MCYAFMTHDASEASAMEMGAEGEAPWQTVFFMFHLSVPHGTLLLPSAVFPVVQGSLILMCNYPLIDFNKGASTEIGFHR